MRRNMFHLLFTLFALGFGTIGLSSCVSAQEKSNTTQEQTNTTQIEKKVDENAIEEGKFREIISKATAGLEKKTYRLTKTEEDFSDRKAAAEVVETNILEIVQPNKRREVKEIKSPTENTRLETIYDGKMFYEKKDNGEWTTYTGRSSGSSDFTSGRTTTTNRFAGKETINNQTADVYEAESHRIANKMTRTSRYRVEYIVKTKYWISKDGLFLKTLRESEIAGNDGLRRETEIYEYDPKIKIKAPIK